MHFDGMPINETVKFKVVHCDINGAKKVGVSAPPPPPAPKPVPNQLVINYTGSLAETSCQPPYPYSGGATTIHAHTPTPVTGSETADKVQCYGPSVTFIHSDNVWSNSSGSSDCTPYAGVDGAYTCTVTDAP